MCAAAPTGRGQRSRFRGRGLAALTHGRASWVAWALAAMLAAWAVAVVAGIQWGPMFAVVAAAPFGAMAALVSAAACLATRRWAPGTVAVCSFLALGWVWFPSFAGRAPSATGQEIAVVSCNLRFGAASPTELAQYVEESRADVVVLVEATPSALAELRRALPPGRLPSVVDATEEGPGGAALLSDLPITAHAISSDTIFADILATVDFRGTAVNIAAVHPPGPTLWRQEAFDHDWAILQSRLLGLRGPTVIAGDFNATPNHRQIRALMAEGYESAATTTGSGFSFTWPTTGRLPGPLVRIDDVLFRGGELSARSFGSRPITGTDHDAIAATIASA